MNQRLSELRLHSVLTSKGLVLGLIIFTLLSLAAFAAGLTAFFLLLVGLTGALLLLFAFGHTYFPYRLPAAGTSTSWEKLSSFWLFKLIGRHAASGNRRSLLASLHALFRDHHLRATVARLGFNPDALEPQLENLVLPVTDWPKLFAQALLVAEAMEDKYLTPWHVLGAWLLHPAFRTTLRQQNLREADVYFVLWWQASLHAEHEQQRTWWRPEQLLSFSGLGLAWTSGYTPLLNQFLRLPPGSLWHQLPLGRDNQVGLLINTLARDRQSNVLLVGQPGVGRLGIVKEVERRIRASRAHPELDGLRLAYLNLGQLTSFSASAAAGRQLVGQVLREMERAGNVIAVLDGLGSLLGTSAATDGPNLADLLLPFFAAPEVRVIVIASEDEYRKRLAISPELMQRFEVVQVPPLDEDSTLKLLALLSPRLEQKTRVFLPFSALQAIVNGTSSILPQVPYPERAFDLLEEALVVAGQAGAPVLTPEIIYGLISQKVGVNLGELASQERTSLLALADTMHLRLVNQEQAVQAISRAMIRARTGVRNPQRPIGTFLFLGPTGVGKTEAAKTLAAAYFGSEDRLQRLDMSEFQGDTALERLLGTPAQPAGQLTTLASDHPFSVILLDEFEKADPSVHQLFLQVFDEGRLTTPRGYQVRFNHSILITTSNAGAEFIRQNFKAGKLPQDFDRLLRDHILTQNIFRPELINRFDGVITFTPLTPAHLSQIAALMLRKLNERLDLEHGFAVKTTPELLQFLVEIGYNPEFGARPMQRALQNTVEYLVAQKILKQQVEPGEEIVLSLAELKSAL
jgi:ATP-dependent Clp protease ATP-binding subunit ClpC